MNLIFADDSRVNRPSLNKMGPLISIGGLAVKFKEAGIITHEIDKLCRDAGFPKNDEFKWSPGQELWMRRNLIEENRKVFYLSVLEILSKHEVKVFVCINDKKYKTATGVDNHEMDVAKLFLERIGSFLKRKNTFGLVIIDRPSGDRSSGDNFLFECLKTIEEGTDYVKPENFAHNVVSTPSKFSRLIQCADLITGCTTAKVGGESNHSPPIYNSIKKLFHRGRNETGGYGLKIHPDYRYDNLYHWLLDDTDKYYGNSCWTQYPLNGKPFSENPYIEK